MRTRKRRIRKGGVRHSSRKRHGSRYNTSVGTSTWRSKVNKIQKQDHNALSQLQLLDNMIGNINTDTSDTTMSPIVNSQQDNTAYTTEINKDDAFIIVLINVHGTINCEKPFETIEPRFVTISPDVQMLNRIVFTIPGYSDVAHYDINLKYDEIVESDIKSIINAPNHKVVYGNALKSELDKLGVINYKKSNIYKDEPIPLHYDPFLFRSEMYVDNSVQLRDIPKKYYSALMSNKYDYYSDITVLYQQNGDLRTGTTIFKQNLAPFIKYMTYNDESIKEGHYYISIKDLVDLLLDKGYTKIQLIDLTCETFSTPPVDERDRRRLTRRLLR